MALSDSINRAVNRTNEIAGRAAGLAPLLPQSLRDSLDKLLGFGKKPESPRGMNLMLSKLNKLNGVSKTNLFHVRITPPKFLSSIGQVTEDLNFLTESCSLPGVSLATTDIRRHGIGVTEKKPYVPIFTDQSLSFLGDGRGSVHKFFYQWMNGIVKYDQPISTAKFGFNGAGAFEVDYKEQYMSTITITTFDELHREIIVVELREAFPIFMGDIALNWNDVDSIMRIPVTFTYLNWERTNINVNLVDKPNGENLSLLQKLIKAGNAIQTLASIRKPRNVADVINAVNNAQIAVGKF